MAKFFLVNSVLVGTNKLVAGSTIDDAQYDTAKITAAGGVLLADDSNGANIIAAAAARAKALSLRGGNHEAAESIMTAALQSSQTSEDALHDIAYGARIRQIQLVIPIATIQAKGAVTSGTFDAASAFPTGARLLGCEASVDTQIQNAGNSDTTTFAVGTDGASKSAIVGTGLAKTAGLKGGGGGIGFGVGGEKLRVTLTSSVNFSTLSAGQITVTALYTVPAQS